MRFRCLKKQSSVRPNAGYVKSNETGTRTALQSRRRSPGRSTIRGEPVEAGALEPLLGDRFDAQRRAAVEIRQLRARDSAACALSTSWSRTIPSSVRASRDRLFDLGIRRIIGRNLPNAFQSPDLPTPQTPLGTLNGSAPFDYVSAGNVSFAFHFLAAHNEFYVVYGDPNSLATTPALFVKLIRYIGAEKGT